MLLNQFECQDFNMNLSLSFPGSVVKDNKTSTDRAGECCTLTLTCWFFKGCVSGSMFYLFIFIIIFK